MNFKSNFSIGWSAELSKNLDFILLFLQIRINFNGLHLFEFGISSCCIEEKKYVIFIYLLTLYYNY